jgi:hypothetical protein
MQTLGAFGSRISSLFTPRTPRTSRTPRSKLETGEYKIVRNIDTVDKFIKGEVYTIYSKGYGLACGSDWRAEYLGLTDDGKCKFRLVKHPRINTLGKNKEDFLVNLPSNTLKHVYNAGAIGNTCKEDNKKDGKYFWSADGPVPSHLVKSNKNGSTRKMRKSRKNTRKMRKD